MDLPAQATLGSLAWTTHRQPPLTLFGIREHRPRLKCWLQVVVRGGGDGFARRLPKLGTRFAFEPLLCKRPPQPSLRSQNQRCTVRESRNFPTCTNSSRPTTMTSKLSGRTASKKRMGIGEGSSTTWYYATLTVGSQKEASLGSFAKIAGVNSYFASLAKPGIFARHATPREPRHSQLFFKRSFWKTSAMRFGVFPFPKCSARTSSSTASSSLNSPARQAERQQVSSRRASPRQDQSPRTRI